MRRWYRSLPRPARIGLLVLLLAGAVVLLVIPPEREFQMEGQLSLKLKPADPLCPWVAPDARQWTFELPAESRKGHRIVQRVLGKAQCREDCAVQHTLSITNLEWKSRAGYFSGYSEFAYDAELVRTGPDCQDKTILHAKMWVDQGSRGNPADAADAMGRWALEWYQNAYDRMFGPPS